LGELRRALQLDYLPIHSRADESLLVDRAENLAMLALLSPNQGRQDHQLCSGWILHHRIANLGRRLRADYAATFPAVWRSCSGKPHAKIGVDLGSGRDGRAGIARCRSLFDRDRRRQAFDLIDVRLLKLLEELARVGGKRLDILALPLGVNGVESESRFA